MASSSSCSAGRYPNFSWMERSSGTMLPIGSQRRGTILGAQPLPNPKRPKVIARKRLCLVRSRPTLGKISIARGPQSRSVVLKRRRDQPGHVKISPLARPVRENRFELIVNPAIPVGRAAFFPSQLPIAPVEVKQIPILGVNCGCQVGRENGDRRGSGVPRPARVSAKDLLGHTFFPARSRPGAQLPPF